MDKTKKYPGLLGEPIPPPNALVYYTQESTDAYLVEREAACLHLLMSHYGIELDDPDRWLSLAVALALDHVPGMTIDEKKRVGRPYVFRGRRRRGKTPVGRPRGSDWQAVVKEIDDIKESGEIVGRVTDKAAIELLLRIYAQKEGLSEQQVIGKRLKKWQKRLSEARRQIPEIHNNSN